MIEELIQKYQNTNDFQNILLLLKYLNENNLNNIGYILCNYFYNEYQSNPDFLILFGDICFSLLKFDEAYKHFESVYNLDLSKQDENLIKDKLIKTIPFIKNNFTNYNLNIINNIKNKIKTNNPKITFSITTCKRIDLFIQTINSFLNCCIDLEMIDEWILVDDNSSYEDKIKMKELYPFFTFIFKDETQKGHPQSMNIIKDMVKTEYLFHMEDDWVFFKKDNYITKCLKILEFSEKYNLNYKQVLINKNYSEVEKDLKYIGGIKYKTEDNQTFYEHQYLPENSKELEEFLKDYDLKNNTYDIVYYWPHYSFRPSLLRTEIFKECGNFRNDVYHFEREYAHVYNSFGYKSVFLPGIYSIHVGKLTNQIDNNQVLNAYELNQTLQYQKNFEKTNYNLNDIDCFIINLNRRLDRFKNFEIKNKDKLSFLNYKRYSAIDGKKLKHSRQLELLFNSNTYSWNAGAIGCALSHIDLWINFLKSDKELLVIFEDDAKVVDNFQFYFGNILKNLTNITCDLMFLGHHSTCLSGNEFIIRIWEGERIFKETLGGTFGYIINKNGCRKILEFIEKEGMYNCIDTMMLRCEKENNLKIWVCEPLLVYSTCYQFDINNDTDIQYETYKIYRTPKKRLEKEIELFKKLKIPYRYYENKDRNDMEIIIYNNDEKENIKGLYYDLDNTYYISIPESYLSILNISKIKTKEGYSIYDILN